MMKYNNKKVIIDKIKFDSKLEANCYLFLKPLFELELQPRFELQKSFKRGSKTIRKIEYVADFKFKIKDKNIIIDSKGMETPVYKLKYKLLVYKYPEIEFYAVKSVKKLKELITNL
jgi:hypothetical protein